jgi:DNA binding domain, excisionase family
MKGVKHNQKSGKDRPFLNEYGSANTSWTRTSAQEKGITLSTETAKPEEMSEGQSDGDALADRIVARLEVSFQVMLREAIAADRREREHEVSKMAGPKTNDVFTVSEAAAYLGMKPDRLREACRRERIAFVRHNRRYSFKRSDLDDFLTAFRHPRKSVFR